MIEGCYISVVTLIVNQVRLWLRLGGEERGKKSARRGGERRKMREKKGEMSMCLPHKMYF